MTRRITSSLIAKNALYMMSSQLGLALLQGAQFFLIARALGPHEFGRVASVVAFTSALLPFSGLGLGNMAIMRLARGQGLPALYLGNAWYVASVTGTIGIGVALLVGGGFLNDPGAWLLLALFGFSEILLTKYIDIASHVFYGLERHEYAAVFYNLHMLVRVVFALGMYFLMPEPTAQQWAVLHVMAGLLTWAIVATVTIRHVGRPRLQAKLAWAEARQGVYFSVALSARSVYTDIDKAALGRFASMETAGAYTAAYRLVHMAFTPVIAVLLAVQARMFRDGAASGLRGTKALAARLCLYGTAYCAALAVLIYGAAPLVPWLLGNAYALSTEVMHALCLLPLLLMLQGVHTEALNGAGAQKVVAGLHTLAALTALGLNLVLVPLMSWRGSVIAAYGAQVVLVLTLVAATASMRRREVKAAAAAG